MAVLTSLLLCGQTQPTQCTEPQQKSIGPSGAQVAVVVAVVAGVVIGSVILIEVHHDHHTVKGCVFTGPNGVQVLNEGDKKTYTVIGATQNVKVGDRVRLSGSREKMPKGSTGDRTFVVTKLSKDFGGCKGGPAVPASTPATVPASGP